MRTTAAANCADSCRCSAAAADVALACVVVLLQCRYVSMGKKTRSDSLVASARHQAMFMIYTLTPRALSGAFRTHTDCVCVCTSAPRQAPSMG